MSESSAPQKFALRRKNWAAHIGRSLASGALKYHRIVVEGAQHLPCEGPALLLPKHRAYRDILVEGVVLYRITRRYATYVMKVGLYGILELPGGVKIVRPKDIRRLKDREARKARIRWAREKNQYTLDYLAWLYGQGEMVISHPEGTRYQDDMGAIQREIIDHLLQVEQEFDLRVPLIPLGLEYESYRKPLSRVYCRVGEPLFSDQFAGQDELTSKIAEHICILSGFRRDGSAQYQV